MPKNTNARATRLRDIEKLILSTGSCSTAEIAEKFKISAMTVHRDLELLEESGIIRRIRGGATALSSNLLESHIRYRQAANLPIKRRLASAAVELVEPSNAVMLDDSTTVGMMYEGLSQKKPLTIISNSVNRMMEFARIPEIKFVSLGGEYNARYAATVGLMAEESIKSVHPDFVFMSAHAMFDGGIYHPDESIVRVKKAMLRVASKAVLLIDSTKLFSESLYRVADLSDFYCIVVDSRIDPDFIQDLKAHQNKIEIIIAE